MDKKLETKFLFDKIKKIYPTFDIPDEFDIECWTDILKGYSQDEIILALKSYRKTIEYNTPPIPATFSKFLHQENGSPKQVLVKNYDIWNIDPALGYYLRDVETKNGIDVHALIFYRWALRDIIAEKVDSLPKSDKMGMDEKISIVRKNSWDNDINERVERYVEKTANQKGDLKKYTEALIEKSKSKKLSTNDIFCLNV